MNCTRQPLLTKVSDLRSLAHELITDRRMPSLRRVLEAVAETRRKYADKIRAARKETRT